jgi:hypothetical protein
LIQIQVLWLVKVLRLVLSILFPQSPVTVGPVQWHPPSSDRVKYLKSDPCCIDVSISLLTEV